MGYSLPSTLSNTTCVIGGAGFIGRAVVTELISRGRQVVVIGRNSLSVALPAGAHYVRNSPETGTKVMQAVLETCTEVIDLAYATTPGTSFVDPVNDILANVPETVRLFELVAAMPHIRKFVWISSGGTVYGRTMQDIIPETHPENPISPYGITKLALEKYAHMYFETRKLPIVCVRPANAYGEGQRAYGGQGFIATTIASILDQRELTLFGENGTIRDYLHVSDMAAGIVAALFAGEPGQVYNLGSETGTTNRQIIDMLAPLAKAAGRQILLNVQPARPFDVPTNVLDCRKLRTATGWVPRIPLADGLARTWAWFAAHSVVSKQPTV